MIPKSLKQKFKKNQKCDLNKAVDRYKVMYESSQDALITLEPPNWRFTSGNPAAFKIFGVKSEKEFISLGLGDLSPQLQPDGQKSQAEVIKMIQQAMKKGSIFFEWTHQRYKGENFSATVLLTRFKFCGQYILEATVRDVSEQKMAEEKLKIKNFIFDHTLAANSIADANGIITEVNQKFLDTWGFSNKKEVIGKPILYFLKNKSEALLIVEALDKKGNWNGNYVAKKKNGSTFIAYGSATKLTDHDGKIIGYQSSVYNVTKERKLEEEVISSEEKLEKIFNYSPIGIEFYDENGKLKKINKIILEIFGLRDEKEVIGFNLFKDPNIPREIKEIIKKGEMARYESFFDFEKVKKFNLYNTAKKGAIYLDIIISPIKKGLEGYLVIINDITESKNAQINLKKKLEEMEKINKLMIGRELRMIELKNKIEELKTQKK